MRCISALPPCEQRPARRHATHAGSCGAGSTSSVRVVSAAARVSRAPACHVRGGDRLRCEGRIVGRPGERAMQLRRADGERLAQREVQCRARRRAWERRCGGLRGSAPGSRGCMSSRRPGWSRRPAAAPWCRWPRLLVDVLDGAGDRHDVGEVRDLGEIAADLELRDSRRAAACGRSSGTARRPPAAWCCCSARPSD